MSEKNTQKEVLLYGGIAAGILLGAVAATVLWRRREEIFESFDVSPEERAANIISNVESKLNSIERAIAEIS